MALKPDEIFAAADALHAEGEQPTTTKVFQRLGRGSLTTIQKYLREWRPKEGVPEVPVVDMPDEMRDAAIRLVQALWRHMAAVTQGEIDSVRRTADQEVKRIQGECDAMIEMVDERHAECERLAGHVEALTTELRAEKDARVEGAARLHEKEGLVEELRIHIGGLQAERDKAQDDARMLERNLARAHERNEVLEGKNQGLLSENRSLEEELQNRLSDMHQFRDERDDARREVKAREQVEEELRRSLQKEEARGAEVGKKYDELAARFAAEVERRTQAEERLLGMEKGRP